MSKDDFSPDQAKRLCEFLGITLKEVDSQLRAHNYRRCVATVDDFKVGILTAAEAAESALSDFRTIVRDAWENGVIDAETAKSVSNFSWEAVDSVATIKCVAKRVE